MSLSAEDRELAINPLVPDSIAHNTRVLSNLRSLTASVFGIASGILGLESWRGFLFYFAGSLVVSTLIYVFKASGSGGGSGSGQEKEGGSGRERRGGSGREGKREKGGGAEMYFQSPLRELWVGEIVGNLMSFVLTWTLFYGLVGG